MTEERSNYETIDINNINSEEVRQDSSLSSETFENEIEESENPLIEECSHSLLSIDSNNTSKENLLSFSEIPSNNEEYILDLKKTLSNDKCLYWADVARIISILSIIFLHSAEYDLEPKIKDNVHNDQWMMVYWYNCISRFGIPMFILLSGTFILDPNKDFSLKIIFSKHILRLVIIYTFWSTVNALLNIFLYKTHSFSQFFELFLVGEEYLWLIYIVIGCYLISPILRLFSDNIPLARYVLILCVIWGSFIPSLQNIFMIFKFTKAYKIITLWTEHWPFNFTLEFVGYFVAGYHIVKYVHIRSNILRIFLYFLAIVDIIFYSYITCQYDIENNTKHSIDYGDHYTLSIAFFTITLFIFFKHEIDRFHFLPRDIIIINKLSFLALGAYFCHMIIKKILTTYLHISQYEFLIFIKYNPAVGCPILWLTVTILSFLVSYGFSKIPLFKNYII